MRRLIALLSLFAFLQPLRAADGPPPDRWREPLTGMQFVRVPAGCYPMGDTFGGGETNELPVHEVCLESFWIGQYEVTQAEWLKAMPVNLSVFDKGGNYPMDSVNQTDIATFVGKLAAANPGRRFRLPTEAEWEYACRGGGRQERFAGEPPPAGANTAEHAAVHGETSQPVGSFPPNALGLYDMSGNLWEWVADVYASDAYLHHDRQAPRYTGSGPSRLLRGGAWSHDAAFARCSKRHMHCRPSARFDFVGFRLVLEAE